MRRFWQGVAVAYAFIGIFAFGHAAADEPLGCPPGAAYCLESDMAARAIGKGLFAGTFWPLYFSWVWAS
jgi:hypothetical protein